jgi:VWFA-related protein
MSKRFAVLAGFRACYLSFRLKPLCWAADNCFVKRSALGTGLSLAVCGLTLAGVGGWTAGRFDSSAADDGPVSVVNSSSSHDGSRVAAAITPPLPILPEAGDHLPAGNPGYVLTHDVPEVRLQFTVTDEYGHPVANLSPDDIDVFDNDAPVTHFTDFGRDQNVPLHLGLVLDTSDSVKRVLGQEKAAAIDFLGRVLRPQADLASVMAFGGDVKIWQNSTADQQALTDAIGLLQQAGWGTRLFDALYSACTDQLLPSSGQRAQRVVIVISDGGDTASFHNLAEVIAAAQRSEVQIYAVTIRPERLGDDGLIALGRLTEETGGRLYVVRHSGDLNTAFTEMIQGLRAQYRVTFPPQKPTPGFHALRIEMRPQQKLRVHARQGYFAALP